ncbi:MAG: hypothetical protein E4G92_01915, partial [Bacteroidia bacterium]
MEKLNLFFAQIKDISWWQRLFRWRKIRTLSFDAYEEFRNLARELDNGRRTMDDVRNRVTEISTRNESLTQKISELEQQSVRKETQAEELNSRIR